MTKSEESLCIFCEKVCNGGCSWSKEFTPVRGWNAEKNANGYLVRYCPEFEPDGPDRNRPKDFDRDGMMLLMESVAKAMRDDYSSGTGPYTVNDLPKRKFMPEDYAEVRNRNRKIIENWIKNGNGKNLLQLSDPDAVIQMLRQMARRHDQELLKTMTRVYR